MTPDGFSVSTYWDIYSLLLRESRECRGAGDTDAANVLSRAASDLADLADGDTERPLRLSRKTREQIAADEGGE